ncbi:unnamed protein product [Hymenolepis diminuta]|uniref:Uncharacterized protein n=1 Tax=Hymenolepis diminuta TaxID=6216 RepID=A0A564XWY9_HYMDI|nr:unnamed protein product [Hymenolepis diminuta]VUZ55647.1 unnamed protein product [Hymenolepis diminuta]
MTPIRFSRILTQLTQITLSFPTQEQHKLVSYLLLRLLLISTFPQQAPLFSLCHSFQTRCGSLENTFWLNQLLVLCLTIHFRYYSNSYELVTIIAVVIC